MHFPEADMRTDNPLALYSACLRSEGDVLMFLSSLTTHLCPPRGRAFVLIDDTPLFSMTTRLCCQ